MTTRRNKFECECEGEGECHLLIEKFVPYGQYIIYPSFLAI